MKNVFLHLHDDGDSNWSNQNLDFERIPVEGEYITTSVDSEWYRVELVIHTPFSTKMSSEVYAVKVDHQKEFQKKVKTKKGSVEILK